MGNYKYFTLAELIASPEAKKRGMENIPDFEQVEHLSELVEKILDPLRFLWGKAIRVTSGFRCQKVNKIVGGVATSVHMAGWAADIVPASGDFETFRDFVVRWLRSGAVKFDQCLVETNKKGDKWIHIAIRNNAGQQRGQIKNMNV